MQGEQYQRFLNRIREKAMVIDDIIQTVYMDYTQSHGGIPEYVELDNDEFYLMAEKSDSLLDLICQMKNFIYDMEIEAEKILENRKDDSLDV